MCFFLNAGHTRPFPVRSNLRSKWLRLHSMSSTNRFHLFPFQRTIETYYVRNNPREDLTRPSPVLIPTLRNSMQAVTIRNLQLVPLHLALDPDCVPTLHEPSILPFLPDPVGKGYGTVQLCQPGRNARRPRTGLRTWVESSSSPTCASSQMPIGMLRSVSTKSG